MASTMPSRTRSFSSGSTTTLGAKNDAGVKKKFSCTFPSCGKSFSRSEHLHRHALNHKDGNNTCLRCAAHFRRRDLLDRHMARHKEKDDEAGGEGLGVLATRKRLWRDEAGKIVNARRPSYINSPAANVNHLTINTDNTTNTRRRQSNPRKSKNQPSMQHPMGVALPSPPMSSQARSVSPNTIVVESNPSSAQLPPQSYLPSSPPAPPQHHKVEDSIPVDPWLSSNHGLPLPLPSPPMSEASLGSNAHSHHSHHDSHPQSHEPSLYDEPHHPSWPVLHHPNTSANSPPHHPHHRSHQPAYMHPPPSWQPSSQPFQTFMGSEGHSASNYPDEEEMGIFKSAMEVPMGMGMYDWNGGQQQPWGSGMMSRCREERYDGPEGRFGGHVPGFQAGRPFGR